MRLQMGFRNRVLLLSLNLLHSLGKQQRSRNQSSVPDCRFAMFPSAKKVSAPQRNILAMQWAQEAENSQQIVVRLWPQSQPQSQESVHTCERDWNRECRGGDQCRFRDPLWLVVPSKDVVSVKKAGRGSVPPENEKYWHIGGRKGRKPLWIAKTLRRPWSFLVEIPCFLFQLHSWSPISSRCSWCRCLCCWWR